MSALASVSHLPPPRSKPALVASAVALTRQAVERMAKSPTAADSQKWQEELWRLYDTTGELRYATTYEANAMSLATLFAAKMPDSPTRGPSPILNDDEDETTDHPANVLVSELLGGPLGQQEALYKLSIHLAVPGVSYIVAFDRARDSQSVTREWHVLSNKEVRADKGTGWRIRLRDEDQFYGHDDVLVIRVWNQHPSNSWRPDSPTRALIPVLSELEGLTKHVSATIDSRLAGAGILALPSEMTFTSESDDIPEGMDAFEWALVESMTAPIAKRDIAAALVPLLIRAPGEQIANIQHITFASPLDPNTHNLRNEAIRRIALGMDIPPEILLGLADANHWSAWQIEDSSIKLHVEPKLRALCRALTDSYLHPALRHLKVPDWDRYLVWFDTNQLRLRPNRASDARELHGDVLITDKARRLASGFTDDDAPDDEQFARQLVKKLLIAQPQLAMQNPGLTEFLGIELPIRPSVDQQQPGQSSVPSIAPGVSSSPAPKGQEGTPDRASSAPDPAPSPGDQAANPDV